MAKGEGFSYFPSLSYLNKMEKNKCGRRKGSGKGRANYSHKSIKTPNEFRKMSKKCRAINANKTSCRNAAIIHGLCMMHFNVYNKNLKEMKRVGKK